MDLLGSKHCTLASKAVRTLITSSIEIKPRNMVVANSKFCGERIEVQENRTLKTDKHCEWKLWKSKRNQICFRSIRFILVKEKGDNKKTVIDSYEGKNSHPLLSELIRGFFWGGRIIALTLLS